MKMLSVLAGVEIKGEYDLVQTIRELSGTAGIVPQGRGRDSCGARMRLRRRDSGEGGDSAGGASRDPSGKQIRREIKSVSPSIHMIKANIETEIAPIVGSEQQAEDLIAYIKESAKSPEGIWNTNIFGKSVEQLVDDGIRSKIAQITEDGQAKLQDSMQKIVNDGRGGMVCIII